MDHTPPPSFQPLPGFYEPSAIVQLPDRRFLVVEDQGSRPASLVTIGTDGSVAATRVTPGLLQMFSAFWSLDDLEGLTIDTAGFIYGITSHSRDAKGDEKKTREKLVRFRIQGDRLVEPQVIGGLKQALTTRHAVLAQASQVRDVKDDGGLNIEGLEISPDQQRLLVGFRSPLRDGRALIASIENPQAIFSSDEAPRISATLVELNLGGQGIRGLSYVPAMAAYVVISGPTSRARADFRVWRWSGEAGAPAVRMTVKGLQGFEKAEGVSPAVIGGREQVIFVSDDGNRSAQRPASYLLIDPALLQTADGAAR